MTREFWGITAGIITLSGYMPQIIKGYKTKNLNDLSYGLNFLMGVGMLMRLIYGIVNTSISIILSNTVAVIFNVILIIMKYTYTKNKYF